jgi:aryl-alcohol dehydrogenase-like predicted oxidoreductase
MEQRLLGNTSCKVSAIGLGCAGMSEGYGTPDDAQSLQALSTALEYGVSFFDTSDAYGPEHNEKLLGQFLQGRREHVVLATKFGLVRKPGAPPVIDNSPQYVRAACEASLRRLGIETIDLYYLQRRDPNVPVEDVVGAMADLVRAGKVRYLGLSEVSSETLRRAHAVHPVSALQSEYSLWTRGPESNVLDVCRELGVSFVAYCPLGRAFLTGAVRSLEPLEPSDFRRRLPRFQNAALDRNLALLPALETFASERHVSCAQIALAWLLRKHPHVIPIPGSRRAHHIIENAAASNIALSPAELSELEAMMPASEVLGDRYPPPAMMGIETR